MSSIDERIVEMKFDNGQFERGIKTTTSSLDSLKKGLNLDGAAKSLGELDAAGKRFSLAGLAEGIETVAGRFGALAVIGITALANITNSAVNAGLALVRSLTIDPIKTGLQEYETQLNSVQTILANTQSKGTTLDNVNAALAELNGYADKTIYNFAEMARNIGTFTAAGVDLDTSVASIKGIANLAALSGSNSQQASTAMYQLSQAISTGTVKLMDWNSVVNAGMGGEVFQEALMQTARNHGVAVDDLIAQNGSFRDSLHEGWLSSDILTETLNKFTGDLTDAQLLSMGYTQEQIVGIQEMAQTASDAATKVKTMSQLIGTLQEAAGSGWAATWQIIFGDFEEAKDLFTNVNNVLGGMISSSADARNALLQGWSDLGGRTAAIEAIGNAFTFLMAVFAPIKEAFTEIFPPMTAQQLFDITDAIRNFTQSLTVSDSMAANIKSTFAGLFAILDIGRMIIVGAIEMFAELFGIATEGAGGILDITGNIGDFIVSVRDAIKNGEGLTQFFDGLKTVLKIPIEMIRNLIGFLGDLFTNIDTTALDNTVEGMTARLTPLRGIADFLIGVWQNLGNVFGAIWTVISPIVGALGDMLKDLGITLVDSMGNIDFSLLLDTINTGLFAGLVVLIQRFLSNPIELPGSGFLDSFKGIFDGVTGTLEAMQMKLKADVLLKIAIALGILTVSIVALSLIDSAKLATALGAVAAMFGELFGAMTLFGTIAGGAGMVKLPLIAATLILLSVAIGILAISVAALAALDWNELARGLTGVVVLIGALVAAANLMPAATGGMISSSVALIAMAIAIKILASSVTDLAALSWEEMSRGLVGVATLLASLLIFTNLMKVNKGAVASSVGLVLLGVALKILASALIDFASMNVESIITGLAAMGGVLALVGTFAAVIGKSPNMILASVGIVILGAAMKVLASALGDFAALDNDSIMRGLLAMAGAMIIVTAAVLLMPPSMIITAVGLIVIAQALVILSEALGTMGSMTWDEIGRGLTVLAASLLIIAGAMYIMVGALPGAAALIIVAAALQILAPVLMALGTMSWDEIGRGLTMLAGAFLVLAVGGLLLAPVVPTLLQLSVAILLLGVAVLAAGVGLMAMSIGLTGLAVAGAAGAAGLTILITTLAGLIPMILEQVGLGILAFATVISEGGPAITAAITTVLMGLIDAIVTLAPAIIDALVVILLGLIDAIVELTPAIIDALVVLILALVDAIVVLIPRFVDAGLEIVEGVLQGIADNIQGIIDAGVDIIENLLEGIGNALPRLNQAGIDLILDFINGLADSIRRNQDKMERAGKNLASAIIDGMTSGIRNGITSVTNAARDIANSALTAARNFLGIASPSKEFTKVGMFSSQGLAIGISKYAGVVARAAVGVGETALSTLRNSLSGVSSILTSDLDMDPTIRPVLDLTAIRKDASLIGGMLGTPRLPLSATYDQAADISFDRATLPNTEAINPVASVTNLSYTQNNTSPKTLSPIEIYRQTKNQLSTVKDALGVA